VKRWLRGTKASAPEGTFGGIRRPLLSSIAADKEFGPDREARRGDCSPSMSSARKSIDRMAKRLEHFGKISRHGLFTSRGPPFRGNFSKGATAVSFSPIMGQPDSICETATRSPPAFAGAGFLV